jgi:hypothetical protein
MLRVLRGRARLSARALALLLLLGTTIPTALHAGWDDPCEPALGGHGPTYVQAQPVVASGGEHCAVCHWLRSLRSLETQPTGVAAVLPPGREVPSDPVTSLSRHDAPSIPARAPPA